ncbi:MAG: 5-formyltetrahydrofolate cyclo-ligase [Arenicellales bacterium WSBS_2016_MAG_OTU3]
MNTAIESAWAAGFGDRTPATLAHKKHWNRPKLIGIAHDCQRVDKIESQSWDIPLPAIVTDKQYYQKHI